MAFGLTMALAGEQTCSSLDAIPDFHCKVSLVLIRYWDTWTCNSRPTFSQTSNLGNCAVLLDTERFMPTLLILIGLGEASDGKQRTVLAMCRYIPSSVIQLPSWNGCMKVQYVFAPVISWARCISLHPGHQSRTGVEKRVERRACTFWSEKAVFYTPCLSTVVSLLQPKNVTEWRKDAKKCGWDRSPISHATELVIDQSQYEKSGSVKCMFFAGAISHLLTVCTYTIFADAAEPTRLA